MNQKGLLKYNPLSSYWAVLHQRDHKGSQGTPWLGQRWLDYSQITLNRDFLWFGASGVQAVKHSRFTTFNEISHSLDSSILQSYDEVLEGNSDSKRLCVHLLINWTSVGNCWPGQTDIDLSRSNLSQVCHCLYQIIGRIYFSLVNNLPAKIHPNVQ